MANKYFVELSRRTDFAYQDDLCRDFLNKLRNEQDYTYPHPFFGTDVTMSLKHDKILGIVPWTKDMNTIVDLLCLEFPELLSAIPWHFHLTLNGEQPRFEPNLASFQDRLQGLKNFTNIMQSRHPTLRVDDLVSVHALDPIVAAKDIETGEIVHNLGNWPNEAAALKQHGVEEVIFSFLQAEGSWEHVNRRMFSQGLDCSYMEKKKVKDQLFQCYMDGAKAAGLSVKTCTAFDYNGERDVKLGACLDAKRLNNLFAAYGSQDSYRLKSTKPKVTGPRICFCIKKRRDVGSAQKRGSKCVVNCLYCFANKSSSWVDNKRKRGVVEYDAEDCESSTYKSVPPKEVTTISL